LGQDKVRGFPPLREKAAAGWGTAEFSAIRSGTGLYGGMGAPPKVLERPITVTARG